LGTLETLICLLLIAISGFMSSSEIALFSLSKYQLKSVKERFKSSHKVIKKLLADPQGVLITVLIGNEVVNVAISTLIASSLSENPDDAFVRYFRYGLLKSVPDWAFEVVLGLLITSPILLLACEITPKILAARANTIIAPMAAFPFHAFYRAMTPMRYVVRKIQAGLSRLLSLGIHARARDDRPGLPEGQKIREEDFLSLVEEAHKEGDVQATELELIRNVFDLDDTPVAEISTPLYRVFTLPQTTTLAQALNAMKDEARSQKYSRIPVTGKNKTDITGVLYSKDLLVAKLEKEDPSTPIANLCWKPFFISETTRLNSVFRKMKKQRVHMAITTNDRGIPVGIVTMNDLLEVMLDELMTDENGESA